jgi:hypothetical protein
LQRRSFMIGAAAVAAGVALPRLARANVPKPDSFDLDPPTGNRDAHQMGGREPRRNPKICALDRQRSCAPSMTLWTRVTPRLRSTPRDEFVPGDISRAYERDLTTSARRDHLRPAGGEPHDLDHRRAAGRAAGDRYRSATSRPISTSPTRSGPMRDHRWPSARAVSTTR